MQKERLSVLLTKKRVYCSYQGEIGPAVENLVTRVFHADVPNKKWLTDLKGFHVPAGKVYLSLIIDCFDGMVVSWTISTSPDAELVNTILGQAILHPTGEEHLILDSNRGYRYR